MNLRSLLLRLDFNKWRIEHPDTEILNLHPLCNRLTTKNNFLTLPLLCQSKRGENTNGIMSEHSNSFAQSKGQGFQHALK